jgi:hypothetical protein
MKDIPVFVPVLLALFLVSCAGSYQVVQIPQYAADLYPLSQTKAGVTIAIDEIRNRTRASTYFGADLINVGILPVSVVVSNHGKHQALVKPSEILLHRGKEIIDAIPIEVVAATAKRQHRSLREETEKKVDSFFENIAFKETVLRPNDTYQGVMFFAIPRSSEMRSRYFRALRAFPEEGARILVAVTDLDTGERLRFGPLSLSFPEHGSTRFGTRPAPRLLYKESQFASRVEYLRFCQRYAMFDNRCG